MSGAKWAIVDFAHRHSGAATAFRLCGRVTERGLCGVRGIFVEVPDGPHAFYLPHFIPARNIEHIAYVGEEEARVEAGRGLILAALSFFGVKVTRAEAPEMDDEAKPKNVN
jgi:hypothetical protein